MAARGVAVVFGDRAIVLRTVREARLRVDERVFEQAAPRRALDAASRAQAEVLAEHRGARRVAAEATVRGFRKERARRRLRAGRVARPARRRAAAVVIEEVLELVVVGLVRARGLHGRLVGLGAHALPVDALEEGGRFDRVDAGRDARARNRRAAAEPAAEAVRRVDAQQPVAQRARRVRDVLVARAERVGRARHRAQEQRAWVERGVARTASHGGGWRTGRVIRR